MRVSIIWSTFCSKAFEVQTVEKISTFYIDIYRDQSFQLVQMKNILKLKIILNLIH